MLGEVGLFSLGIIPVTSGYIGAPPGEGCVPGKHASLRMSVCFHKRPPHKPKPQHKASLPPPTTTTIRTHAQDNQKRKLSPVKSNVGMLRTFRGFDYICRALRSPLALRRGPEGRSYSCIARLIPCFEANVIGVPLQGGFQTADTPSSLTHKHNQYPTLVVNHLSAL